MSESLEDLKAIIDNAPEGATIIDIIDDGTVDFLYFDEKASEGEKIRNCINGYEGAIEYSNGDIRSLSDIKRIVELVEQVKASYEAYSRIESVKQRYNSENKQMKGLLKDIIENEDLDDDRYLAVSMVLEGE